MKFYNLLIIPFVLLLFTACQENKEKQAETNNQTEETINKIPNDQKPQNQQTQAPKPAPQVNKEQGNTPQQVNVPATNGGQVYHYVCAKGCQGGVGDAPGNCPVCSNKLSHNQAFHSQNTPTPNQPQSQFNPQRKPEPAQNARGEWHYICTKGCAGGAGKPVACNNCGEKLVHNQKYHN